MIETLSSARRDLPSIPDVGVVALVPDSWNGHWQPRHHVLSRLAQYFPVVWVTPAPEWRETLRKVTNGYVSVADQYCPSGLLVNEPEIWLPKFHRPEWLARFTFGARVNRACRMLIKRGCRRIVLYLWRPEFRAALEVIPWDLSCYHIDDEYSFSEVESFSDPTELALIAKVDQVIIHSPRLLERKGAINPNTIFVPNGVDFFAYAKTAAEPHDMRSIPRPRIGYTGALKRQLDWTLLLELSKRRLDWFFVFVGPQSPHQETRFAIEELSHRPNVYFLGGKSTQDLAAYPQHFDTCIMPYRIDGYTNNIYPLKLHEYLASGRPIVGSPIRSLQDFRHVIKLAATSDEWVRAIAESLAPEARSDAEVEARRSVAREHDWNKLVSRIANAFCGRLGAEFSARFHDLPQHN